MKSRMLRRATALKQGDPRPDRQLGEHSADLPRRMGRIRDPAGGGLAVPMGFLKFRAEWNRKRTGSGCSTCTKRATTPPRSWISLKSIETLEKKKPGTISKFFSSHPPTDDRIKRAQKEIQEDLKSQPEYVLDTSEFHDVRHRLAMLEHRVKNQPEDPNRPTLRRRTDRVDQNGKGSDDDERPTLKRGIAAHLPALREGSSGFK